MDSFENGASIGEQAVTTKSDPAKAVDLDQLSLDLGPVLARKFVSNFLADTPTDLQKLEQSIDQQNLADLQQIVLRLKSNSETLRNDEMRIPAIWLEQSALEKNWAEARRHAQSCKATFDSLQEYLLSTNL